MQGPKTFTIPKHSLEKLQKAGLFTTPAEEKEAQNLAAAPADAAGQTTNPTTVVEEPVKEAPKFGAPPVIPKEEIKPDVVAEEKKPEPVVETKTEEVVKATEPLKAAEGTQVVETQTSEVKPVVQAPLSEANLTKQEIEFTDDFLKEVIPDKPASQAPVVPVEFKEDLAVEKFNKKYGSQFKSYEDMATVMKEQQVALQTLLEKQDEYEKMIGGSILEDPAIKEIISMRQAGAGIDDVIDGLSLLKKDYTEKNSAGQYVIGDDDAIKEYYKKRWQATDEEATDDILGLSPIEKKRLSQEARMFFERDKKERLGKWEKIRKQAEAKAEFLEGTDPATIYENERKALNDKLKPKMLSLEKINDKIVPEKMRSYFFSLIEDDPNWMQQIFFNTDGSPREDVFAEVVAKYHRGVNQKIKDALFKAEKIDEEALAKKIEAKILREKMNISTTPDTATQNDVQSHTKQKENIAETINNLRNLPNIPGRKPKLVFQQ